MKIDLSEVNQNIGDTISVLIHSIKEGKKDEAIELCSYLHGFINGFLTLLSKE